MSDEFTPEGKDTTVPESRLDESLPDIDLPVIEDAPVADEAPALEDASTGDDMSAMDHAPAGDDMPAIEDMPLMETTVLPIAAVSEDAPADEPASELPVADQATTVLPITDAATPVDPAAAPEAGTEAAAAAAAVGVAGAAADPAAAPAPAPAPVGPTVTAGSRVVLVVSTGPSLTPPSAFVEMPDLAGERQGDALSVLQDKGLSVQVFNDYSLTVERGRVMAQRPTMGANVAAGSEVVLLVSSGSAASQTHSVPLPRLAGLTEGEAVTKLQAGGLSPQVVRAPDPVVPSGIVIAQLPDEISLAQLPAKRRSSWWIWAVTALVLFAAVGGAFYYYQMVPITVPNVVGLTQAQAEDAIAAAGFKVGSVLPTQTLSAAEIGNVVTQTPEPKSQAKKRSEIVITVSGGQALVPVPNVVGQPQADAEKLLTDADFQVSIQQGFSATVSKGSVISQGPAAGQEVPINTTVAITVSQGAQNVIVPGVIGQSQAAALTALKDAGLGAQAVTSASNSAASGQVFAQLPTAGSSIPPATVVGILVSSGPLYSTTASATVPSVTGKTNKEATATLKNVGLTAVTILWGGTGKPKNTVVDQLPQAGTVVAKGASVILIVSNGK